MRSRESSGRRGAVRAPQYTILVFCGAVRTEPDYFEGLKTALGSTALTVKVRQEGVDPERLGRVAAAHRDRKPGVYDEVWCVVDVDQFDLARAVAAAQQSGISLAVSNPCFELWLLLHHADCRAHCSGYADVVNRLRKYVPGYDKTRLRFVDYADGVRHAIKRGKDLDPTGRDHERNPSTGVWWLVDTILEKS